MHVFERLLKGAEGFQRDGFPMHSAVPRKIEYLIQPSRDSDAVLVMVSALAETPIRNMKSSHIFEDLIFLLACSLYFVCRRFERFLWDSVEIVQNHLRTTYREHAKKNIRPSKRLELYILLNQEEGNIPPDCACKQFAYGVVRKGSLRKLCHGHLCVKGY